MLLRSSSTSMLKSRVPQEPELISAQITLKSSRSNISFKKMRRNLTESDLTTNYSCMHRKSLVNSLESSEEEDAQQTRMSCKIGDGYSSSSSSSSSSSRRAVEVVVGSGGGGCGGGDKGDDGSWYWDSNHSSMDVYYESMIKSNPGNYMILSNYASFLKEIRGDFVKAEEYFGRAILAYPSCGNVLSLYATLIWEVYEDANRAHVYFDRALKAAPHCCYVMASYARFLWDAEDELNEEDHQ